MKYGFEGLRSTLDAHNNRLRAMQLKIPSAFKNALLQRIFSELSSEQNEPNYEWRPCAELAHKGAYLVPKVSSYLCGWSMAQRV